MTATANHETSSNEHHPQRIGASEVWEKIRHPFARIALKHKVELPKDEAAPIEVSAADELHAKVTAIRNEALAQLSLDMLRAQSDIANHNHSYRKRPQTVEAESPTDTEK